MGLSLEKIVDKVKLGTIVMFAAVAAYAAPSYAEKKIPPAVENFIVDEDLKKDYEGVDNVDFRYALSKGITPLREKTDCVVLHTTDGWFKPSLDKLQWRKEAHLIIDRNGSIYPLVPLDYIAHHAGISRWNGKELLEKNCIGMEYVDNKTNFLTLAQYISGGQVIELIKRIKNLTDDDFLGHYQAAYQMLAINNNRPSRGRKNDGRVIDRSLLGLGPWPKDPDIAYGMLPSTPRTNPKFYEHEAEVLGIKEFVNAKIAKEKPRLPKPKVVRAKYTPPQRRR